MSEDFITSDIGIAAYLQLKGYKLLECKRQQSGKFYFRFADPDSSCQQDALQFLVFWESQLWLISTPLRSNIYKREQDLWPTQPLGGIQR